MDNNLSPISIFLAHTIGIKTYLCAALGPAGSKWSFYIVFCLSFARTGKVSTTIIASKSEQEPNASARCMHDPKRVFHIPFRTASVFWGS